MLTLSQLKVGQQVGITSCHASRMYSSYGEFTVSKINNDEITLTRDSNGITRIFSISQNREIGFDRNYSFVISVI